MTIPDISARWLAAILIALLAYGLYSTGALPFVFLVGSFALLIASFTALEGYTNGTRTSDRASFWGWMACVSALACCVSVWWAL